MAEGTRFVGWGGGKIGSFADGIMYDAALRSVNQHAEAYGPDRMIYSV
jgi:hypothetical protein